MNDQLRKCLERISIDVRIQVYFKQAISFLNGRARFQKYFFSFILIKFWSKLDKWTAHLCVRACSVHARLLLLLLLLDQSSGCSNLFMFPNVI